MASNTQVPWDLKVRTIAFPADDTALMASYHNTPDNDFRIDAATDSIDVFITYRPVVRVGPPNTTTAITAPVSPVECSIWERNPDDTTYTLLGDSGSEWFELKDDSTAIAPEQTERIHIPASSESPPTGMPLRLVFRAKNVDYRVPGILTILNVWVRTRSTVCC